MGCGSSTTNWEERFEQKAHQRKDRDDKQLSETSIDVDIEIPKLPVLGKWGALTMRFVGFALMITSLFDISTDFAILIDFASIGIGSFPFAFSLTVLLVGPQILSLYEFRNNVGIGKDSTFCWYQPILNAFHLRIPIQNAHVFFFDRSEPARIRMLQVKIILSLTVALPQTVLQGGMIFNDEGRDLTFLKCASLAASIFAQAESMGEFCFREGDPMKMRILNTIFFSFWMTSLFLNMSFLFTSSTISGIALVSGFLLINIIVVRVFVSLFPKWSTSTTIIRYITDGVLYSIGFVDVNFRDPIPDTIFLIITFCESCFYLIVPTLLGYDANSLFVLIANACCYVSACLTLIGLHMLKRSMASSDETIVT